MNSQSVNNFEDSSRHEGDLIPYTDQRQFHQNTINISGSQVSGLVVSDVLSEAASFSSEDELQEAINKVQQIQMQNIGEDIILQSSQLRRDAIPIVHPRLVQVSFYEGGNLPDAEEYQPSSSSQAEHVLPEQEVLFEDLLKLDYKQKRFISLIGFPGSGKTTISKRLAKSARYHCFYIKFLNINYKETTLTLRELLLDKAFPSLNQETCKNAFEWIKKNDKDCVLIFDGYDQAEWFMQENVSNQSYEQPQHVHNLVACLCNKHFLPGARIVFTSRPHSMVSLPHSLRPDITFLLQDFSFEDMKKLFNAFAGNKAKTLFDKLKVTAPQLISLCFNPLLLQCVICAWLYPSKNVGDAITMTRVFAIVLANLRRSDNARFDFETITLQICKIAFDATNAGTVVISYEQMTRIGLAAETVQDLVISVQGQQGITCKVIQGDELYYFFHQSFQEYYTALYIKKVMSTSDFRSFLKDLFFKPRWSMVRHFVCGLLLDPQQKVADENAEKANLLKDFLLKTMSSIAHLMCNDDPASEVKQEIYDLCIDVRECCSDAITKKAAENFPHKARIHDTLVNSNSAHALSLVLGSTEKYIKVLRLRGCHLDTKIFDYICSGIRKMSNVIGTLDIRLNDLASEDVENICSILHKVDSRLWMTQCFSGKNDGHRDANDTEKAQIQNALNLLPTSNLTVTIAGDFFIKRGSEFVNLQKHL